MKKLVIIEGVTGAGKTSTIAQLRELCGDAIRTVPEEETLAGWLDQINTSAWRRAPRFDALETTLVNLEGDIGCIANGYLCVLERFHLTAFAVHPHWDVVRQFDQRLAQLGARLILLSYPQELTFERSLRRADRSGWTGEYIKQYGSKEKAIKAIRISQNRRLAALTFTRLPFLHIDTREMAWRRYAAAIRSYVRAS